MWPVGLCVCSNKYVYKKSEVLPVCEIEKKIMREENGLEKEENESEDGVVEHSKEQELESRKICQKF